MMNPKIYYEFNSKESISDGRSVYDFLGGAIDSGYKSNWVHAVKPVGQRVKPGHPGLSEWTIDWIACLLAAKTADDHFTVIELGAGYGQWMVTSIMAYKALKPDKSAHGMAFECETTHFQWLQQHVKKNLDQYSDVLTDLYFAAAGKDGKVYFPEVEKPESNYGASYRSSEESQLMREVDCYSLTKIDHIFNEDTIDLLHVDIQGAEAELILDSEFENILRKTRVVLFGTHISEELHSAVEKKIKDSGMQTVMVWPRNSIVNSPYGEIKTNDGAILAVDASILKTALNAISI